MTRSSIEAATQLLASSLQHNQPAYPPHCCLHLPHTRGRRRLARNLIDAVLSFHPIEAVVRHLEGLVGRRSGASAQHQHHDAAKVDSLRKDVLAWRAAFGNASWEEVLRGAAAGEAGYVLFAMAGELFAGLLSPPPPGVDSLVLVDQLHVWPRDHRYWLQEMKERFNHAGGGWPARLVWPCGVDEARALAAQLWWVVSVQHHHPARSPPRRASYSTPVASVSTLTLTYTSTRTLHPRLHTPCTKCSRSSSTCA